MPGALLLVALAGLPGKELLAGCLLSLLLGASPRVTWGVNTRSNSLHGLSLQDCGMELNDEDGHRCYPLDEHLLCHSCHLKHIENGTSPAAAYQHHF